MFPFPGPCYRFIPAMTFFVITSIGLLLVLSVLFGGNSDITAILGLFGIIIIGFYTAKMILGERLSQMLCSSSKLALSGVFRIISFISIASINWIRGQWVRLNKRKPVKDNDSPES